jgi:hypothetical protein
MSNSPLLPRPPAANIGDPAAHAMPTNPMRDNFLELASSVSGTLSVCIQGFLGRGDHSDAATIQAATGAQVEMTLFPDSAKKTTSTVSPTRCDGEFGCVVSWEKTLSMNVVFSFQQVYLVTVFSDCLALCLLLRYCS